MAKSWKTWIFHKGERILATHRSPVVIKELAWKAVRFAAACGKSNPLSFALRPLAAHERFKSTVGINLAILAVIATIFMPLPSMAENLDEWQSTIIASSGEVSVKTEESLQLPLKNYHISQKFWLLHPGMDFASETGEIIKPIMPGKVVMAEYNWFGYGNCVIVRHASGYESLYGHLSKIMVKTGDDVDLNTILGLVGSTGRSTGPHLHLEIKENGHNINPSTLLEI